MLWVVLQNRWRIPSAERCGFMNMRSLIGCVLLVSVLGCGTGHADERTPPATELDSGNLRYSAGDHAAALDHYRAAASADGSNAAAWFGIYMASLALGDTSGAAEALLQVERIVPDAAWREHPHDVRGTPQPANTQPDAPDSGAR